MPLPTPVLPHQDGHGPRSEIKVQYCVCPSTCETGGPPPCSQGAVPHSYVEALVPA